MAAPDPPAGMSRPFVTIVSGLPRSGASMLIRLLAAGGMPVVADAARPPHEDDPYGWFEEPRGGQPPVTAAWLGQARGRAVGIVSPLLPHLPSTLAYRVVFAKRDLREILAAQHTAHARRGTPPPPADDARILALCERHLEQIDAWLAAQEHVRVLDVEFADVLAMPAVQAARLAAFVGGGLDVEAMARAVDPRLHRQGRSDIDASRS